MNVNFQQWYLRQALASNLLSSMQKTSTPDTLAKGQSCLKPTHVNTVPKVIKPKVSHNLHRNHEGPRKRSDDVQKSSKSAFDEYIKQRVKETETPDFIRGSRINLRNYDIKNIKTHQNTSRDESSILSIFSTPEPFKNINDNEQIIKTQKEDAHFLDEQFNESQNETSQSKSSADKSNFKLRTDVVNKTILRAFKKFYTQSFKSFYDFTKVKKSEINNEEFLAKADEFITKILGESKFGDMHIFLASIVDTKQRFANVNSKHEKLKTQINGLLYSFNKRKVEALLSYPEFSSLLIHFLSRQDIIDQTVKNKDDQETLKVYKKQIDGLKERCKNYLSSVKI